MAKREIFAEAIAEAKLVKETAIENAKAALSESFAPHLQSMISAKLQEMELEDEEDVEEALNIPESDTEETIDEVDEIDELDELLKEIEGENELDEVKEDDDEVKDDEIKDDETKEDVETEEELNIEDMSEEDLKSFIEDVINDMIETGELEPGEEAEEDEEGENEEDIDLNNIEDDEIKDDEEIEDVDEVLEDDMVSNEELEEAYNTINTLRQEINEIKLLNAKLLYSNRIFKDKQLTEGKKLQVLHAFDKVTTIKEAKTTYEILKENLNSKKVIKESFKGSSASKTITPIRESKQPIVEVDDQYKRWQVLAGIKQK